VWIPDEDCFLFQSIVPTKGDRWTFLGSRVVLRDVSAKKIDDPAEAFRRFRPQIYVAARERIAWADPKRRQDLSAEEVHAASLSV
jgi:hypothetical protein